MERQAEIMIKDSRIFKRSVGVYRGRFRDISTTT